MTLATTTQGTDHAHGAVVVLADARTDFEREELKRWVQRCHPGAAMYSPEDSTLAALADDTVLAPARVVWLPPARKGERRVSWADLVALTNPRRPRAGAQRRIARRSPDRFQVVAGTPASITELRTRYELAGQTKDFASFVRRQAILACERAELAVIGDRYKVPRLVVEQVTSASEFREKVHLLATELGKPDAEVLAETTEALEGLVTVQSRVVLDLFTRINQVLHKHAWDVSVDRDSLERLRELNKSSALVFLPSHRSYLDPAIVADALTANDFPPNHVLGGDNMSFGHFGLLGRRSGAIFIRRKFGNDPAYRLAVREYLSFLVSKRFNLEWYLEGGRSRTGKLRAPMLGLLAYLVDAVDTHPTNDVLIVPTSIVYDQLSEIQAMAAEDSGGIKKAENMRWLLNYARSQRDYHGEARVRFAEPFSLREALDRAGEGRARVEKVAFEVMDEINRATPISATSLAGFALLGAEPRAYTQHEIEQILDPMLCYIEERGLPGPDPERCRGAGLTHTLGVLTKTGVLTNHGATRVPLWSVTPGNHAVAAYYRNGAVHHFVNRAITELTLLTVATEDGASARDRLPLAHAAALRLRDLLKFEFFFPDKQQFGSELLVELDLLEPNWRELEATPEVAADVLRRQPVLVARRTLQPFVDAQLVVARQLVALGEKPFDRDEFLADALTVGRQKVLQGEIHSVDSVSRELYANALDLAANRGLLDSSGDTAQRGRGELLDEIELVRERLSVLEDLEAATREDSQR